MFKSRKNQCSYIIFLALFLFFNPILVLAQTGSVTLSMKNATLKQLIVLSTRGKRSGCKQSYNNILLHPILNNAQSYRIMRNKPINQCFLI